MVMTDASLGNVTKSGSSDGELVERVFSQATYVILLADEQLMSGKARTIQPDRFRKPQTWKSLPINFRR